MKWRDNGNSATCMFAFQAAPILVEVEKMKNKEKYAKEILDIVCKCGEVAMNKVAMGLKACDETKCRNCYFCEDNYPHNTGSCAKNFVHWANTEYKESKQFSKADKAYVKAMDKLNWFARDENGIVYGYVDKPFRNVAVWDVEVEVGGKYALERVSSYSSATFESLSWDDDEPTHRNEILGE